MSDSYGHAPRGPRRLMLAARWSMQGMRAAWLHESSFRLEVYLALLLIPFGIAFGRSGIERVLLCGSVLAVLAAELLNSAIEAIIERYGAEHHELAGRAKDMGSAAVFILLANVALTWALIFAF